MRLSTRVARRGAASIRDGRACGILRPMSGFHIRGKRWPLAAGGRAACCALIVLAVGLAASLFACSAPASQPPPSEAPTATLGPILSPTPTERVSAPPTLPPTVTLTPSRTPTLPATPVLYAFVSARRDITVYSGPGEGFLALALLLPAEQVILRGQDETGAWYFIQLRDGRSGWVSAELLQPETEATPVSTAAPASGTAPPFPPTATPYELPIVAGPPVMPTAGPPSVTSTAGASPTPPAVNLGASTWVFALCDNLAFGLLPPGGLVEGAVIVVWWAWLAETRAQIDDHLSQVEYEVTVDGLPLTGWRDYRGEPVDQGGNWAVHWYVPHQRALSAGEHRIEYRASWRARISDGLRFYGPGSDMPTETGSCTFTVREGA